MPIWKNLSSLNNPPSARYGHTMVGIGSLVFMFGGVYEAIDPTPKNIVNVVVNTNSNVTVPTTTPPPEPEHVKGSFYVLATFAEPLFLPNWLDLSDNSILPVFYYHAAAADEQNRLFLMQVCANIYVCVCVCHGHGHNHMENI
jgi:hypothetical protein